MLAKQYAAALILVSLGATALPLGAGGGSGTDVVAARDAENQATAPELAARRAPSKDDEKRKADFKNPKAAVFTPEQLRQQQVHEAAARLQREREADRLRNQPRPLMPGMPTRRDEAAGGDYQPPAAPAGLIARGLFTKEKSKEKPCYIFSKCQVKGLRP